MIKNIVLIMSLLFATTTVAQECMTQEVIAKQLSKETDSRRDINDPKGISIIKDILVEMDDGAISRDSFTWDAISVFTSMKAADKYFVVMFLNDCMIKAGWMDKELIDGILDELDKRSA